MLRKFGSHRKEIKVRSRGWKTTIWIYAKLLELQGTTDAIFIVRQILEMYGKNLESYI